MSAARWVDKRWIYALLGFVGLAAFIAIRVATVQTESINWDEFSLGMNTAWTVQDGEFHSAGRPGLVVMLLMPFIEACVDEIEVIRSARLLWIGVTLAGLFALACLVAQQVRADASRLHDALLVVALVALVPAHLEWSIQVRTDQLAIVGGLWGSVALVASRRTPSLAVLSGLLFGIGYLASQKLIYVASLGALLAAADVWRARDLEISRELLRLVNCLATLGTLLAAFFLYVSYAYPVAGQTVVRATGAGFDAQMQVFDFYRNTIGYSQYRAMLPTLIPHAVLTALLVASTFATFRVRCETAVGRLVPAWIALALGMAVGLFHAGAFQYFWMTLGLFPAVALALAQGPIRDVLFRGRAVPYAATMALVWTALAVPAGLKIAEMLRDTQAVQSASLAFVHRNFDRSATGFQAEGALFCREEPYKFPVYFSQLIYFHFGPHTGDREQNAQEFIETFEQNQVKFLLESWRIGQFPEAVRDFWASHYLPYHDSVLVAGSHFQGPAGTRREFDLVVDGEYRWLPRSAGQAIEIDGVRLEPGLSMRLSRGAHLAVFPDDLPMGFLVLAVDELPVGQLASFYQ